jgi:hypothetical protein
MSQHNTHTLQVLWDNLLYIGGGIASWTLAAFGIEAHNVLGAVTLNADFFVMADWVFSHLAILLSCSVSVATLVKIRKEIKGKDQDGKKG